MSAVVVVVLLLAFMHVTSPPVPPEQEVPEFHPAGGCVLCHFVSENADRIELE